MIKFSVKNPPYRSGCYLTDVGFSTYETFTNSWSQNDGKGGSIIVHPTVYFTFSSSIKNNGVHTIDLDMGKNVTYVVFPDGQIHIDVSLVPAGEVVNVVLSLTNPEDILKLIHCCNALDNCQAIKGTLTVPYLYGARHDRLFSWGNDIGLQVIANIINSLGFRQVELFDPHSESAALLIKNSNVVPNHMLVSMYDKPNALLICPDAGAAKKIDKYFSVNPNLSDVVYCTKQRSLDGKINLKVHEPEKVKGRDCIIIDDICDGGGTFIEIANQVLPYFPNHLTLMVSHGIFSKPLAELYLKFNEVIVSNSYFRNKPDKENMIRSLSNFKIVNLF